MKSRQRMLILGANSSLAPDLISRAKVIQVEIDVTVLNLDKQPINTLGHSNTFQLDLRDAKSCENFSRSLVPETYDYIVSLIGATSGIPIESATYSDIEKVFQINVIGVLSILPWLQKALNANGRMCFVSSSAAKGDSFDVAYAASKAALSVAAKSYSLRVPEAQAIFTIEPTAIENSKMFAEMSAEVQNKHSLRAQGKLLQIAQVNSTIIELLTDSKQVSGNFFVSNELPK
jgi:NAD(P)-dependent dehydrogenase (short-subunit alcohol dehydrogenase family)